MAEGHLYCLKCDSTINDIFTDEDRFLRCKKCCRRLHIIVADECEEGTIRIKIIEALRRKTE